MADTENRPDPGSTLGASRYCENCGTVLNAGDRYCPACGADSMAEVSPEQDHGGSQKDNRKKWILISAAAAVILIIVLIAANWDSYDYVGAAKAATPFEDAGMPYTLEQVFDYYLTNPSWKTEKTENGARVSVSGSARGTGSAVSARVEIQPDRDDPDWYQYRLLSVSVGGSTLTGQEGAESIYNIFRCYDIDFDTLAPYVQAFGTDYMSWTETTWSLAVYSQKAGAAEVVLMDAMDSVAPNLSALAQLAGQATIDQAVDDTIGTITNMFNNAQSGTTIQDMMTALRAALGFLKFLFAMAG